MMSLKNDRPKVLYNGSNKLTYGRIRGIVHGSI